MNEKLESLLATLIIAHANFRTVHWMSVGHKFDRQHSLAEDYEGMVDESIDAVAEMLLRGQKSVPTIVDAPSKSSLQVIDGTQSINYAAFNTIITVQLKGILTSIATVLKDNTLQNDIRFVGIKADLEGMFGKYDLQLRYLHAHRIQEV